MFSPLRTHLRSSASGPRPFGDLFTAERGHYWSGWFSVHDNEGRSVSLLFIPFVHCFCLTDIAPFCRCWSCPTVSSAGIYMFPFRYFGKCCGCYERCRSIVFARWGDGLKDTCIWETRRSSWSLGDNFCHFCQWIKSALLKRTGRSLWSTIPTISCQTKRVCLSYVSISNKYASASTFPPHESSLLSSECNSHKQSMVIERSARLIPSTKYASPPQHDMLPFSPYGQQLLRKM